MPDVQPTHKFIGTHAEEVAGVMRGPGDTLTLTNEDLETESVKTFIADGRLLDLSKAQKGGDN